MTAAVVLGEYQSKLRELDGVCILWLQPHLKARQVPIRASTAVGPLKEFVRALFEHLPEIPPQRRKRSLAKDVCLQSMKRELVLLFVVEDSRFDAVFGRQRVALAKPSECANR